MRALLFSALFAFLTISPAVAGPGTAEVLSVIPTVTENVNNVRRQLTVKASVPVQAVLTSDATGKAQIMLPDTSTISLAPDSELALVDFALLLGELYELFDFIV